MQAASYIGFEPNYGKGRRTLVMELRENGKKIDEILIKNANTPNEHYFDRNKKGGDLISFIKNHINDFKNVQGINNEWLKINTVLSDIAADGVYINVLSPEQQSKWIGWQGAFFNVAKVISLSGFVYIAGALENSLGLTKSWMVVMGAYALVMISLSLYHTKFLPKDRIKCDLITNLE